MPPLLALLLALVVKQEQQTVPHLLMLIYGTWHSLLDSYLLLFLSQLFPSLPSDTTVQSKLSYCPFQKHKGP